MELLLNNEPIETAVNLQEWQAVEFACVPPAGATLELLVGDNLLEAFLRPGDAYWRWRWNPQNAVGLFHLTLRCIPADGGAAKVTRTTLRVAPRKLAQDHYALLLEQLQQDANALLVALAGSAEGAALQRQFSSPASALESYAAFFGERLDAIERAAQRAAHKPHSTLVEQRTSVSLGAATTVDGSSLADIAAQPLDPAPPDVAPDLQRLLAPEGGLLPRDLLQRGSQISYDTPENRLVRDLVDELLRRARQIGRIARQEAERLERNESLLGATPQLARMRAIVAGCANAERRLRRLRALPYLATARPERPLARPTSQVLQRDPAYRQLYSAWRDMRANPLIALESPTFHLPIQDLPALYEIWSTVQVALALIALPGWSLDADALDAWSLPVRENGFQFRLLEDVPLLCLMNGERSMTLRYQARYRPRRKNSSSDLASLDRHTRVPDLAIELRQPDRAPEVLIFDAKYRLDATGGVPEDALADAYTYRGSIGRPDGSSAVRAALLLYPGIGRAELYASGVGALPLLPNANQPLHAWLQQALAD